METEGLDFKGALEALADRFGVKLETEDEDPGGGLAPPAPRAASTRCSAGPPPTTGATCGRRRGAAGPAIPAGAWPPGGDAARVPGRLCARAPGTGSSSPRAGPASARRSCWRRACAAVEAATRAGCIDRFRGRMMFPPADARGRVLGFGARAMGEDQRPEVPEHRRRRGLPQARGALRDRRGAGGGRQGGRG